MRKLECFKKIDTKDYVIWSDAGPHFRCAEFLHYLFNDLAEENITVSYNLFGEKHGKNSRDQHFSTVSSYIKQESFIKRLTSSKDICDAIVKHQQIANKIRDLKNKKKPEFDNITQAYVIPHNQEYNYIFKARIVENLRCYYNFFNHDYFIMKSHVLTDNKSKIEVSYKDKTSLRERENKSKQVFKINIVVYLN